MNILQQQEALKDMSESQLIKEARRPSGSVPSYMILSELNRRKDMRQRYQANQGQPNATVAEELITQTEQGLGSMMPRQPQMRSQMRPQMPMQQSAIAQNQPMRMQDGGVIRAQAGLFADPEEDRKQEEELRKKNQEDLENLSDDELLIAANRFSDPSTAVETEMRDRLFGEQVRREQIRNDIMASNAQANAERRQALEAVVEDPLGELGEALAGNPNLRGPSLRETELARQQLQAEQSEALAAGAAEGRVGSTDPTPLQTQARAEETIEQIIEADPSLAESGDPRMVSPFLGADEKVAGASGPVLRTDVPAIFDDAGDETVPAPQEVVYDDAQDEVLPVTPEGDTGGATQVAGGISSLPLPLLLEAARFGADIAERGTRGEDFLGSIAGAGKTSIDRGLKLMSAERKAQQARDLASVERRQGLEDFLLKEQIKKSLRDPESASISELNTVVSSLQDELDTNMDLTELERDRFRAQIAELRRMMRTRAGLQQTAQNLAPDAEAELSARRGG